MFQTLNYKFPKIMDPDGIDNPIIYIRDRTNSGVLDFTTFNN